MSNLIPVGMDRHELAALLRDMADRAEVGDSYEGNIEYHWPDEEMAGRDGWPAVDADFWVHGVYRVGNLQGQGGMRVIGKVPGVQGS